MECGVVRKIVYYSCVEVGGSKGGGRSIKIICYRFLFFSKYFLIRYRGILRDCSYVVGVLGNNVWCESFWVFLNFVKFIFLVVIGLVWVFSLTFYFGYFLLRRVIVILC